jgi:TubC N-terminal docking domain
MMLMLLLTELARLEVQLSVASDGLHVQAPVGALTDELRQAVTEHKSALMRYASIPLS